MGDLGRNCATKNRKVIQVTIIRKRKHERLDDYIGSEIRKTQRGARLDRDGDRLIQVYTPHSWRRLTKSYYGFINRLPKEINASITYYEYGEPSRRASGQLSLKNPSRLSPAKHNLRIG